MIGDRQDPQNRTVVIQCDDPNIALDVIYRKVNDDEVVLVSVSHVDLTNPDNPVEKILDVNLRKEFDILSNLTGLLLALDRVVNSEH